KRLASKENEVPVPGGRHGPDLAHPSRWRRFYRRGGLMKLRTFDRLALASGITLSLVGTSSVARAQGKGHGKGQDQQQDQQDQKKQKQQQQADKQAQHE